MAQSRQRTSPLRTPCTAVLVPLALALLAAWPVLALGTLVPVIGLVSFPTLLSCTASLFFVLPATLHLLLAQPTSPRPSLLPRLRLLSPLANVRLLHWALLVLHDAYAASLVALALETLTKRVLLVGGRDAHAVLRENIAYAAGMDGAASLRLDVYLPQPRRARRRERERDEGEGERVQGATSELAPVVVLLPSPSYRLLSLSRTFPSPLIAHRLARLGPSGALVVVPALSGAMGRREGTAGIERAVGETRAALEWVAEHAAAYGADAGRCTVLGYGAGAHVGLLTLVQSAVVCACEALLDGVDDQEEKREEEEEERGEGGSASAEVQRAQLSVDDGTTSSGGGTPRRREQSSSTDFEPAFVPPDTPTWPHDTRTDSDNDSPTSPASPTRQPPSPSSSSSSRSSPSLDLAAATTSSTIHAQRLAPLTARDVPSGVRACRLRTLPPSAGVDDDDEGADEPEYRGEALASFSLPRRRGGGRLRVQGIVLVGGTYDVVKQGRWLEGWGAGEVSSLARFCNDDERDILQACPSHLLYAASPLLARAPSPSTSPSSATAAAAPPLSSLLPPRFLLIHGGRDPLVPFSQATLLRNLLVGIGVGEARLRLCRDEGGLGALATLMHPTRYSPLVMREIEHVIFDPLDADADAEGGGRGSRTSGARRSRTAT